jgi:hypothetical protein
LARTASFAASGSNSSTHDVAKSLNKRPASKGRELINAPSGGLPESALAPGAAPNGRSWHFRKVPEADPYLPFKLAKGAITQPGSGADRPVLIRDGFSHSYSAFMLACMNRDSAGPRRSTFGPRLFWAGYAGLTILAAVAVVAMVAPLHRIGFFLEEPNEGWNATHALHAFDHDLYPPPGSFIINNYPPLWFYLMGLLYRGFGDPIFPGRVVALLAFAGTAIAIFALVRRLGASLTASLASALSCVATMAGLFDGWVGLAEPQMLAHALVTIGAAMLVGTRSRGTAAAAAVVMVLGGLTKHTVIALPLASAVWILAYRRDLGFAFLGTALLAAGSAVLVLLAGYDGAFIYNATYPRLLSMRHLATNLASTSRALVPIAAYAAVAWTRPRQKDPALAFAGLSIAAGFVTILAFGSALGVSSNISFDLLIAGSIAVGMIWDRLDRITSVNKAELLRLAFAGTLAARVAIGMSFAQVAPILDPAGQQRSADMSATLRSLRDGLAHVPGPVACETLSLCAWAGHPSAVDLWKFRHERTLSLPQDKRALLLAIGRGDFAAVVFMGRLSGPQDDGNLPGLWSALVEGYTLSTCCGEAVTIFWSRSSPVNEFDWRP